MDALRSLPDNKACFDCREKGVMYCVMAPFGVFVCSQCAGIHREINNKVKGISMSVFNDQELAFLRENGNKNQQAALMSQWNAKRDPIPDKRDQAKFKEFLKQKYVQKRFCEEAKLDNSDDDSSEEEERRRKARKEKKKEKKRLAAAQKQKAADSSDGDEEIVVQPRAKPEPINPRKLGQPPGFSSKPVVQPQPVQNQAPVVQPQQEIADLLSFDSVPSQPQPTAQPAAQQEDQWATGWGEFEETTQSQPQPVVQQQQPAPTKTDDKLSSLISGIESLYVNNEPPKPSFQTAFPSGGQILPPQQPQQFAAAAQQPQPNQMLGMYQQQMTQMQQQMQMMQSQQQSNPQMQGFMQQMHMQMQQMQQMMQQAQMAQQQQQFAQPTPVQVQQQQAAPQKDDKLADIFNSMQSKPVVPVTQAPPKQDFNPFGDSTPAVQQPPPSQSSNFNPFDF